MTEHDAAPQAPSQKRVGRAGGRTRTLLLIACAIIVYLVVVLLYAASGRSIGFGSQADSPPHGGVLVHLEPQSVDAAGQTLTMTLSIELAPDLTGTDLLAPASDISILIGPVRGSQALEFKAGAVPSVDTVTVLTSGIVENWPFDTYHVDQMVVQATKVVGGIRTDLPTIVRMDGSVPGWNFDAHLAGSQAHQNTAEQLPVIVLSAARSGSTVAFGLVLLILLAALPVAVIYVAVVSYRGKHKIEAGFLGWIGAMLFATVPLRGFLPGSPPIGSWIDYLIVLWVVAGHVTGLVIYVIAWRRWADPTSHAK